MGGVCLSDRGGKGASFFQDTKTWAAKMNEGLQENSPLSGVGSTAEKQTRRRERVRQL